jgi:hypothetical protein
MRSAFYAGNLTVTSEARVPDPLAGGTARMDILVSERVEGTGEVHHPRLVVEVGLDNKQWWKKFHQGISYLRCLEGFRTSKAALLAVVTVGEKEAARIGVFLVTPKLVRGDEGTTTARCEYRVSLLRHEQTASISELSSEFGRVLRATCQLPAFLAASDAMLERGDFRYLGPSCCLVKHNGKKVSRPCFPNRTLS